MAHEQRTIANALDAGGRWTAKWLADLRDAHEGTDTEHLVQSAEKALRRIEQAKAINAAAPDMLAALDGIVHFADGFTFYRTASPAGKALEDWIEEARSVIEKATGQ